MTTPRWRRSLTSATIACLTATSAAAVIADPATAAVPDFTYRYAIVDTDNCYSADGQIPVHDERPAGCRLNDAIDGTFFHLDADAVAFKIVFREGDEIVAKFEFHPYDEVLWAYDTRNDGAADSIRLTLQVDPPNAPPYYLGPFFAPGTDAVVDIGVFDLNPPSRDIPEGSWIYTDFWIYDGDTHNIDGYAWGMA
jgi:hypothetical protein